MAGGDRAGGPPGEELTEEGFEVGLASIDEALAASGEERLGLAKASR